MVKLVYSRINLTQQHGSALIVALVFLLAMTLIGVAAMRDTTQQESMAGNVRQRNLAFQATEAGLRSAEQFVSTTTLGESDFAANTAGLYEFNNANRPVWVGIAASNGNGPCPSAGVCSAYSGTLSNLSLSNLSQPPEYFMESMPDRPPMEAGTGPPPLSYFRITSRGFGSTSDAIVVLRTIYRSF
ncbi:MAG: hypothetical protein LAE24_00730 [Candidatus Contendobacter sp.]|nr:hypothetical protein [Candidatus Contendobacter sp.]